MQRIAAVWHVSPQKLVGVLFALLLAAAMAVGSGANFTTSSSNLGNAVTAGKLTMTNSQGGAIFTFNPMRPDDPAQSGTIQLSNTGDGPGAVKLTMTGLTDTNVANPASKLSTKLHMVVREYSDNTYSTPVNTAYDGLVSAFPAAGADAGTWNAGSTHYFKFSIDWPGTAAGGDNPFQGASSTMDFKWGMVQA
jgi:spore coat-associated protein N